MTRPAPAPVADLVAARRRRLGLCGLCGASAGAVVCLACVEWHQRITAILERNRERQAERQAERRRARRRGRL